MRKTFRLLLIAAAALLCANCARQARLIDYVDPLIGSGGHGHVFVGASVPFGMVQLGPTSVPQEWDWCSGYHQSDSSVIGFSHTHLSGTGIGDLFDITLLPLVGDGQTYTRGGIALKALREGEVARPGYYKVPLSNGVTAEMTASERVGFHRYTFPSGADAAILVNLDDGGCWDSMREGVLEQTDATTLRGHRFSSGWAARQKVWFEARFSQGIQSVEKVEEGWYRVNFGKVREIEVKVALSPESVEAAAANMAAEVPGWDFAATLARAEDAWEAELSKIRVDSGRLDDLKIFYTALYHTMISPALFSDAGASSKEYTIFSLWDTYRALMPLSTIIHPEMEADFMNTFIGIYNRQGRLPVWHLWGNETDCMIGTPGVPVMADAILKGFGGFDVDKAYEAMKATAMGDDHGQALRKQYGYIPSDLYNESVAWEMEYALSDWSLAQVARKLGKEEDYQYFLERSKSYRRHFDPKTRFMRGVTSKGEFREPFSPFHSDHRADDYSEGNAWQYTWLAPHDFKGLIECFGTRDRLLNKLDSLFVVSSELEGEASPDISGLIGQYAHGNEPSHHILYFYTMAGKPWKAADRIRETLSTMYKAAPDGLSGNEDAGQMSAWYILSSLGFYQVEPAGGRYWFGSPLFRDAEISLPGGKFFRVLAENVSDENRYIQSITLNGRPYTRGYIDYSDIMAGGVLRFVMGSEPKLWYNADEPEEYVSQRPAPEDRLFTNETIESEIRRVASVLSNPRLQWMFANCFPNTLDTTVHFTEDDGTGHPDTFVYTGDIHAMWLRDSGAQVWPYLRYASTDAQIRKMLEGTIRRQFKCIVIDPYANAFNMGPTGSEWERDYTSMNPYDHERKWEIDSQCYPVRLAYGYWKQTGDAGIFDETWIKAMENILHVLRNQQRKEGHGEYYFARVTDRQYDTKANGGYGNPVNPVGLIASAFRPSDDATVFEFLIPSNFFAVTSLRKAAEILTSVNAREDMAKECLALADEVEAAIARHAIVHHPEFGDIYAFEVDGFGNTLLMDDANVPSLLAMAYLGDIDVHDPVYQNTRRFVLSASNPYRFSGPAGTGIGGPHIGFDYIWPMSIMMRAFTSTDDAELQQCIQTLMTTDAGTGFMHESFRVDDPSHFTRKWFAWQNTLFGELILKIIDDGKADLLNEII